MKMKRKNRNLDGIYFRVERDGKWENVCFSDLTDDEKEKVSMNRSAEWWKSLALHLAYRLREIGDYFDIVDGEDL